MQLPPIRRQIISLVLKKSDLDSAMGICAKANDAPSLEIIDEDGSMDELNKHDDKSKISAFQLFIDIKGLIITASRQSSVLLTFITQLC